MKNAQSPIMPGLVPGIHVFELAWRKMWMAGTSPAMALWVGKVSAVLVTPQCATNLEKTR
jgi:hypothetical protein